MIYLIALSVIQFTLTYTQLRINYINKCDRYKDSSLFWLYIMYLIFSIIPFCGIGIGLAILIINTIEGNVIIKIIPKFNKIKLMDKIFMADKERN